MESTGNNDKITDIAIESRRNVENSIGFQRITISPEATQRSVKFLKPHQKRNEILKSSSTCTEARGSNQKPRIKIRKLFKMMEKAIEIVNVQPFWYEGLQAYICIWKFNSRIRRIYSTDAHRRSPHVPRCSDERLQRPRIKTFNICMWYRNTFQTGSKFFYNINNLSQVCTLNVYRLNQ